MNKKISIIIKIIIYFFYLFIIIKSNYIKINHLEKEKNYKYFFCFTSMGKLENKYAKELIDYYKNLGVKKFYIADNNDKNSDKLYDAIKEYILDGIVELVDVRGIKKDQTEYFGEIYELHKSECKWMSFYDFDEYLEIKNDNENMNLQNYFSDKKFEKCNVVLINWLLYNDNDVVKYDNRSLDKRFTRPLYNSEVNRFVKSIIKGNLNWNPWSYDQTSHRPKHQLRTCDSNGNKVKTFNDVIRPPRLDNIYIKHFATKTAEEFIEKIKRGHPSQVLLLNKWIDNFFNLNTVTEEKVKLFESKFNLTFPKYNYIKIYKYFNLSEKKKKRIKYHHLRHNFYRHF